MSDAPEMHVDNPELYEPPELTVVGELGEMTKGAYSMPHSDDGDAGGYWAP
ncbi:MAG: hypothetical protein ACRDSP_06865 [Pseudonocardiaceae bacterium]